MRMFFGLMMLCSAVKGPPASDWTCFIDFAMVLAGCASIAWKVDEMAKKKNPVDEFMTSCKVASFRPENRMVPQIFSSPGQGNAWGLRFSIVGFFGWANFMNYHEYIRSKGWFEKRAAFLRWKFKNYDRHCENCGREGPVEVHHKTYERLGREWNSDLMALCFNCHDHFHLYGTFPSQRYFHIPNKSNTKKAKELAIRRALKRQWREARKRKQAHARSNFLIIRP